MLQLVDVGRQPIDGYAKIVGSEVIEELRQLASELKSLRVAHINATSYGGGVSELLRSIVPLENDLGLRVEWRTIFGEGSFFKVTKDIHNALQGAKKYLDRDEKETYLNYNVINSRELNPKDYDIIVVHDPQPAALIECCRKQQETKWVWRCHIDTSRSNEEAWDHLKEYVLHYHKIVFTMKEFVPPKFPNVNVEIMPPAIDPLSPKNLELSHKMASRILAWLGIFPGEPFITQVSRFDRWKDPLGVIKAYKMVKESRPSIHLALVGSMALDDPEAWEIYSELTALDTNDIHLHVLTNLTGVGNMEVNAFQRLSSVVIQKSIREGFGLVVSEALWKGTPVVAGRAGGIPMQLTGGGGFLIDSVEECADRTLEILENDDLALELGKAGRENIKKNFLITRLLRDELELFRSLVNS